jgi:hypothetical protein
LAFCACPLLYASTITIGFDDLSEGTIVTNQYASSDVAVSGDPWVLTAGSLLDEIDFPPHSGTNVIADVNGPVTFSFAQPASSAGAWFTYTQELTVQFFSPTDSLLDTITECPVTTTCVPNLGTSLDIVFTSASPVIGSMVVTSAPDGSGPSFTMDDLTITTTPEPPPGILLLLGLALTTAVYWDRKRRASFVRKSPKILARFARLCLIGAVGVLCRAQTPGIITSVVPSPSLVTVGIGPVMPATVTVVANVALNSKLIPTSVDLTQVKATGALVQVRGPMYDDGTHGDAVAGDNLFTTQISVPRISPTTLYYRATAAYTGSILRGQSPIASITVANPSYATSPSAVTTDENNNTYPVNQAVLSVAPGASAATVQAIATSVGGTIVGYNAPSNLYQLQVPSTTTTQLNAIVTELQTNPNVAGAAKNYVAVPFGASVVNDLTQLAASMSVACSTPHNPSCATAAYDQVSTIPAYQFLADVNPTYSRTVIGVIDSGVDASLPKFVTGVNFGLSATDRPLGNCVNNLTDGTGHGTADIGIIGANCTICATGSYIFPQMNGILSGIPPAVPGNSAVPYVIESRNWGKGTYAEVLLLLTDLLGLTEPADTNGHPAQGVDVLVLPFGWYEEAAGSPCPPASCIPSTEFTTYANNLASLFALAPGVTVVVAAGDDQENALNTLPAVVSFTQRSSTPPNTLINNVIAVAATDLNDNLANWSDANAPGPGSNFGVGIVDIAAPGSSVYVPALSGSYNANFEGTSASAALVGGTAGLMHSIHGGSGLNGPTTIGLLEFGADTISSPLASGLRLNTNLSVGAFLVDVFFLIDTTGSMGPSINGVKKTVENQIVDPLGAMGFNVDFGVAQFKDYPTAPYGSPGDFPYQRVADIATLNPFWMQVNEIALFNLISPFSAAGGADTPEAQLTALYQMATGLGQDTANPTAYDYIAPNQQADWRTCPATPAPATCQNLRIAVLITDASFHSGGIYPDIPTTISALNGKNIKVIGIQPSDGAGDLDQITAITQFDTIANGTNSLAPASLSTPLSCGAGLGSVPAGQPLVCTVNNDGTGMTNFITNAIIALARQMH